MAYVTIMRACFIDEHEKCERQENTPEQIPGEEAICGGGHCVCICHARAGQDELSPFVRQTWLQTKRHYAAKAEKLEKIEAVLQKYRQDLDDRHFYSGDPDPGGTRMLERIMRDLSGQ